MKSRRFSLVVLFALSLTLVFSFVLSSLRTGTASPAPANNDSFQGKLVMCMLLDTHTVSLENAQIRKLADGYYVVGKGVEDGSVRNFTKGQMTWLPMNRIELIIEFGSKEEIKKAWQQYNKENPPLPLPPVQAGSEGPPKE